MRRNLRHILWFVIAAVMGCDSSPKTPSNLCGDQTVDIKVDSKNCGACGNVCPNLLHAGAACNQGVCTRGPCDPGWADLDSNVPGCETECPSGQCGSNGAGVLPETGAVFQAFASGSSSYGPPAQASANYQNTAVMGEPTPPGVDGYVSGKSTNYENISGLNAALH